MTARDLLLRGLLAGFVAGVCSFAVAHQVGEPQVDAAIAIEATDTGHEHTDEPAAHSHEGKGTVVSRHNQSTWGLATGTVGVGTALGGVVALIAAVVIGRIGQLRPAQSTSLVAIIGFVAIELVPFLKYPANPPAVGNADTIASRTGEYFAYMLISVIAAVAAVTLARYLLSRVSVYRAVVGSVLTYLIAVVVAGQLMPTVNEIGDFPADTLWYFRRASILTLATMWGVIGVILTGLVGRLHEQETLLQRRRDLAATL